VIVLGITETHCATAAVLRDGAIVGCASEERFSRIKNDAGYPRQAVDAVLRDLGIAATEIDLVALAGRKAYPREWMNRVLHDMEYARTYYGVRLDRPRAGLSRRARKLGARLGLGGGASGKTTVTDAERIGLVTHHLGVPRARIIAFDHHACHAASAYFGAPFEGRDAVVLTNDNSGDGLCATASRAGGTAITRLEAASSAPGSLGSFYSFATLLLGMKFGEDEFQVMGLARYASDTASAMSAAAARDRAATEVVSDAAVRRVDRASSPSFYRRITRRVASREASGDAPSSFATAGSPARSSSPMTARPTRRRTRSIVRSSRTRISA